MSEKVKKMIEELQQLDNTERDQYLEWLYEAYFNPWDSPEQKLQAVTILEMFSRGELVMRDDAEY